MIPKSLLFLCLLPSLLFSQELLFENYRPEISTFDPENDRIYHFSGDSISLINMGNLTLEGSSYLSRPLEDPFINLRPIWLEGQLHLSEKNGGGLYRYTNDSLHRIDQSNIQNWQSFSSLFVKRDTLYKYGGYGYWTTSNALSYYDKTSKGWEVVPFSEGQIPLSTHSHKHKLIGDELYVLGGYHVRGQNRLKTTELFSIWKLELNTKKWSFIGTLNIPDIGAYKVVQSSDPLDFELFHSQEGLIRIDLKENVAHLHLKNPLYFNVEAQGNLPVFKHKGFYYYYDIDNYDTRLKKVPESDFVLKETAQVPFYTNKASMGQYLFIAIAVLLLMSLLFWWIKKKKAKKKTLYVYANKLSFNQRENEINSLEYEIIRLLQENIEIESAHILSMVYNESLTKSHNEKIKTQTIEALNLKLSYVLGDQQSYISSEKSKEDKRIRVYQMALGEIMIKIVA